MKTIVYLYGFTDEEVEGLTTENIEVKIATELRPEYAAPYLVIHKRAQNEWDEELEEESGGYHFILDTYDLDTVPSSIPSLSFLDKTLACSRYWPNYYLYTTMTKRELNQTWAGIGELAEHAKECKHCARLIFLYETKARENARFLPLPVKDDKHEL